MTDKDNITLPREVVQFVLKHLEWWNDDEPQEKEAITALRTALAAPRLEVTVDPRLTAEEAAAIAAAIDARKKEQSEDIEALRRENERLQEALAWAYNLRHLRGHSDPVVIPERFAPLIDAALAAEQPKHPGYVIGSHWLETAYSRICAGEAEEEVLRDCGWRRCAVGQGLTQHCAEAEALRTALAAEQPKPEPVRCNPADYCAARHMNLYTAPPDAEALRRENERLRELLRDTTFHLGAAVDLLKRGGRKAVASNKMFGQMLADYTNSFERGRAALRRENV